MSQTIGQVINQLQRIGELDIISMNMDSNEPTYHHVRHRYKDEIIIPYLALERNMALFSNKGEHHIIFSDGAKGKVITYKEVHICEAEEDIKRIYGMDAWTFMRRWYLADKGMDSMHFIYMKIEKEG